jgi:hypothetical protein
MSGANFSLFILHCCGMEPQPIELVAPPIKTLDYIMIATNLENHNRSPSYLTGG